MKALNDSVEDDVLVIDTEGSRVAVAGEMFATAAQRRGLGGIVIDGAFRDTAKVRTLAIPVYSRSITPLAGATTILSETQVSITCGGVPVNPGDVIFGDDDGIIVASVEELGELIPTAEEIQAKEAIILNRMEAGESLIDMLNYEAHLKNLEEGKESQLVFTV